MHPFSALTLGIFVAGYTTARWDLVTRLIELAIFAWNYGVVVSAFLHKSSLRGGSVLTYPLLLAQLRAAYGFVVLSGFFLGVFLPVAHLAARESDLVRATKLPPSSVLSSPAEALTVDYTTASSIPRIRNICARPVEKEGFILGPRPRTCHARE